MNILLADSGSTKTNWLLCRPHASDRRVTTPGLNPFHTPVEDITHILRDEVQPSLDGCVPEAIFFYGSGCTPEKSLTVQQCLHAVWPSIASSHLTVHSDLLGAARALCGRTAGVACILGTGSNSCFYDGTHITMNVPPLGYILGDEGGGAYLGKRFVGDCLKGLLPEPLRECFLQHFDLTPERILNKVYKEPMANRFLAGLAPFIAGHRDEPAIHALLVDSFTEFIRRNLTGYPSREVHAVGSIAHYFAGEWLEALRACGYTGGRVMRSPIEGLRSYHLSPEL